MMNIVTGPEKECGSEGARVDGEVSGHWESDGQEETEDQGLSLGMAYP